MEQHLSETLPVLWRFIRGDMPAPEFEAWAYDDTTIEGVLGVDLYAKLVSTPFVSAKAVDRFTDLLRLFAERVDTFECRCLRVANVALIDKADREEVFRTLERIRERGEPFSWLSAYRCTQCEQAWLVAQGGLQNDVFCLGRLTAEEEDRLLQEDHWPTDFDRYEKIVKMGHAAGRATMPLPSARDINPLQSAGCPDIIYAEKNFLGKSSEHAYRLFLDKFEFYREDMMYMGRAAFCFYLPAAIRYAECDEVDSHMDEPKYDALTTGMMLYLMRFRWQSDRDEIMAVRDEMLNYCQAAIRRIPDMDVDPDDNYCGDLDGDFHRFIQALAAD